MAHRAFGWAEQKNVPCGLDVTWIASFVLILNSREEMGKWTCLPHQGNYFPSRNPLLSSFSRSNIIIFSEDSFAFLLKLVPEIGPNLSCYNRWDFTLFFSYPFHHWLSFLTLSSRLPSNKRFCKMTPKEKAPVLRPAHFPFQVACSSQPATTWPRHRHCLCLQCTAMLAACCRQTIPPIHPPISPPHPHPALQLP